MRAYAGVSLEETIVVLDDLDHRLGNVRVKRGGSVE